MSENHPTRRDVLMSLAALPFLASALEAQTGASPVCLMSAVEMAGLIRAKKLSAREALTAPGSWEGDPVATTTPKFG